MTGPRFSIIFWRLHSQLSLTPSLSLSFNIYHVTIVWSSYIIIVKFFLNLAPKWSLSWDDEVALWVNELDAKFNNLSSIHGIYNIKGEFILTGYPLTFICMEIINIFW